MNGKLSYILFKLHQTKCLNFPFYFLRPAVWKSWYWHLIIDIGFGIDIGIQIFKRYFTENFQKFLKELP